MTGYLADEQIAQLLRPINPRRVGKRDGMSHLEAYDVRAHLNRVFGFARWSENVLEESLLFEDIHHKTDKDDSPLVVSVGYKARLRLDICAPDGTALATYTEAATGGATNFPMSKRADAHDFAIKTAESQALKRCAINLGDQFGLSLYAKGSTSAIVGRTLISAVEKTEQPVDEHVVEVPPEDERVEPPADTHEQSETPQEPTEDARALRVADLTAQLLTADKRADVAMVSAQVMKEKLGTALTDDGKGNVLTLGALAEAALKNVTRRGAA